MNARRRPREAFRLQPGPELYPVGHARDVWRALSLNVNGAEVPCFLLSCFHLVLADEQGAPAKAKTLRAAGVPPKKRRCRACVEVETMAHIRERVRAARAQAIPPPGGIEGTGGAPRRASRGGGGDLQSAEGRAP